MLRGPLSLSTGLMRGLTAQSEMEGSFQAYSTQENLYACWQKNRLLGKLQFRAFKTLHALAQQFDEPIVIFKGHSAAKYYTTPFLRPIGDIDICTSQNYYEKLTNVLKVHSIRESSNNSINSNNMKATTTLYLECGIHRTLCQIDIHRDLSEYKIQNIAFNRLVKFDLFGMQFCTLCDEDHLRLLCVHFLKHGGWRPIWLCDIAAMGENLPPDFDWERCLHGKTTGQWIAIALQLSEVILGAETALPNKYRHTRVPEWLIAEIYKRWAGPMTAYHSRTPLKSAADQGIKSLVRELKTRWPDPISATYQLDKRFDNLPQLPYQVAATVRSTLKYLKRQVSPVSL